MMSILIISSKCINSVLSRIGAKCGNYHCVALANRGLLDDELIEMFDLLRLPELLWEHVLIPISDTTSAKTVESPLIKVAFICNSGSMILVDIDVDEFYGISIVGNSAEDRLGLDIFTATKGSLSVVPC